jgi:hypothetical protein
MPEDVGLESGSKVAGFHTFNFSLNPPINTAFAGTYAPQLTPS